MKSIISKYTSEIKQFVLKSKTEPAPYLHCVMTEDGKFAIYVWDSREIVESGRFESMHVMGYKVNVKDSKLPLKGKGAEKFPFKPAGKSGKSGKSEAFYALVTPIEQKVAGNDKMLKTNGRFVRVNASYLTKEEAKMEKTKGQLIVNMDDLA
jgi:hypothetical protein